MSVIYELYFLNLDLNQILLVRGLALFTDILETYLFVVINIDIATIATKSLRKVNIRRKDIFYGIKLAIIAPHIYIMKFFITNFVVIPLVLKYKLMDVNYIDSDKILLAYFGTLFLSFALGVIYYHIESNILHIKKMIKIKTAEWSCFLVFYKYFSTIFSAITSQSIAREVIPQAYQAHSQAG